jgi:hypothetical protein
VSLYPCLADCRMRKLRHIRRTLSGHTSGSSVPSGSMDSYISTTSDDTTPTELDDAERLKSIMAGTESPEDLSGIDDDLPLDRQDTPGVRATLRESLRKLKLETDVHHHSRHTHHPESTHRHVHHIHHLKHHLRRSGDLIKGRDSQGEEGSQDRRKMMDSPISDDPVRMRAMRSAVNQTNEQEREVESPKSIDSPVLANSQEPVDSPTLANSPEPVDSPELMDSPELVESPKSTKQPELTESPVSEEPTIMDSPTDL